MEHDGFSLDDKRQRVNEDDIPDILNCWRHRDDHGFTEKRSKRLAELRKVVMPLKKQRLQHHAAIHRLRFEEVIASDGEGERARAIRQKAEAELSELQIRMRPLEDEINRLTRQFWVDKDHVRENKYDLSASRYRPLETADEFYEMPNVTLTRLRQLESTATSQIDLLESMVAKP
jgi:type I restriction enzyme M protein